MTTTVDLATSDRTLSFQVTPRTWPTGWRYAELRIHYSAATAAAARGRGVHATDPAETADIAIEILYFLGQDRVLPRELLAGESRSLVLKAIVEAFPRAEPPPIFMDMSPSGHARMRAVDHVRTSAIAEKLDLGFLGRIARVFKALSENEKVGS